MSDDLQAQVIRIIAQQALLEEGDVRPDRTLNELGIDSLGLVEAIFALEEAFDISIPFNANDPENQRFDMATVAHLVELVRDLVARKQG